METASNRATTPSKIGRRFYPSKAAVCTTCLTLLMIVAIALIGKASQPAHKQVQIRPKLHAKNAFFNAAITRSVIRWKVRRIRVNWARPTCARTDSLPKTCSPALPRAGALHMCWARWTTRVNWVLSRSA